MTQGSHMAKRRLALEPRVALFTVLIGLPLGTLQSQALAQTLHAINSGVTSTVESARREAEILLQAQKYLAAMEVMRGSRANATPADTAYWQLFGDLAWDHGSKPEAILAYRVIWEAGSSNARAMERLIQHFNLTRQPQLAIEVGKKGYQQLGDVRWLLLAMDAASQASLWDELRGLSRQAQTDGDGEKFKSSEMFWLLQAHIANHDGDKLRARTAYDNALALNPASAMSRIQILWFEINGGDKRLLGNRLSQWQAEALADPNYWAAYAVAMVQLRRVDESLVWFDKLMREKPYDFHWQLSYVSVLSPAGRPEEAQRLRRDIWRRMTSKPFAVDGMSKADSKALMLAYAAMLRDFDSAAASDKVLRDTLALGYADEDVYEQLVSSSLSQKNFDAAQQWVLRAQADQQTLPAYQLLAVALARKDLQAIDQLLSQRGKDLSAPDRITALRRLGRDELAFSLTEKSLLDADDNTTELLRQHQHQLRAQLARHIEVSYEVRNISYLNITRKEVVASFPFPQGRATLRMAHNALRSDSNTLVVSGLQSENDISLRAELSTHDDPVRLTIGSNQRADKSMTYGRIEWAHAITARLNLRLDLALNGLPEETSALRVIASKDKVSAGLSANLTDTTYARVEFAKQHFKIRNGDSLGRGYRAEGEIGTTIFKNIPGWQVRISGSSEKNQLAAVLPASLSGPVLSPSQTIENVLAPRFSTLGAGTTVRFGESDIGRRRPYGLIDVWVGRQWPANVIAYSLRSALSVPLPRDGQIRAEAFYTNAQSGQTAVANRGVTVWYRKEF